MEKQEVQCWKCGKTVPRYTKADDSEESRGQEAKAFKEWVGYVPAIVDYSMPVGAWKGKMCRRCRAAICDDCIWESYRKKAPYSVFSKCGKCGGTLVLITADAFEVTTDAFKECKKRKWWQFWE